MFDFNCGRFSGAIVEIASFKLLLENHKLYTEAKFTANGILDVRDSVQLIVDLATNLALHGTLEHGTYALLILDRAMVTQAGTNVRLQKQIIHLEADEVMDLRAHFGNLVPFINAEFKRKKFLQVSDVGLNYWDKADEYGREFELALSDAIPDIQEASRCLALERYTACVFHSIRSLEFGLESLCLRLKVTPKNPNWENVLNELSGSINKLGSSGSSNWKQEQQKYSELVAHLRICKNAWRNYVMHRYATYDNNEAEAIFKSINSFLLDLTRLP